MKFFTYEPDKTFLGKFDYEDDILKSLNSFCHENNIKSGWFSVIGAVKKASLGFYDQQTKVYDKIINYNKPMEIVSCNGNISIKDEKHFAHIHMVLSDENGNAFGGHVMTGTEIFAGEFIIHSFKGNDLVRSLDEQTGLPLWGNLY
jgi:predicted DNA-binding protein with PD1-like motif